MMKPLTFAVGAGLLMASLVPAALYSQAAYRPGFDLVTVSGRFGGLSGARGPDEQDLTSWRLGWSASLDVTVWLHEYVGVRGTGTWAQDSVQGTTPGMSGRRKLNKFSYDGDLVLRYPVRAGAAGAVIPYVLGGAGAVSIHQLDSDDTFTKFAGNFGVGIEYRYKRIGFKAEGRDIVYQLDRWGFDRTQHDIAWEGGVSVSF